MAGDRGNMGRLQGREVTGKAVARVEELPACFRCHLFRVRSRIDEEPREHRAPAAGRDRREELVVISCSHRAKPFDRWPAICRLYPLYSCLAWKVLRAAPVRGERVRG